MANVDGEKTGVHALIAWLEQQPPEMQYQWADCDTCLLAQFADASGRNKDSEAYSDFIGPDYTVFGLETVAMMRPRTFGDALARARAAITKAESA